MTAADLSSKDFPLRQRLLSGLWALGGSRQQLGLALAR